MKTKISKIEPCAPDSDGTENVRFYTESGHTFHTDKGRVHTGQIVTVTESGKGSFTWKA